MKQEEFEKKIDTLVTNAFSSLGITQERMKTHWFGKALRKWFWLIETSFKLTYQILIIGLIITGLLTVWQRTEIIGTCNIGCEFACQQKFNNSNIGLYMNETDVICQCGIKNGVNTVIMGSITPGGETAWLPIEFIKKQVNVVVE